MWSDVCVCVCLPLKFFNRTFEADVAIDIECLKIIEDFETYPVRICFHYDKDNANISMIARIGCISKTRRVAGRCSPDVAQSQSCSALED